MTKLLKYCPKEIKEQIVSERIIERYRERNTDSIGDSEQEDNSFKK